MLNLWGANWAFGDLPPGEAGVIYADPPWSFDNYSEKGEDRNPNRHYPTMSIEAIAALPVGDLAARDCALFLWVTKPVLEQSFAVIRRWGFAYKTVGFTWVKTRESGKEFINTGYWTRGNPELCLLATRGAPPRNSRAVRELVELPEARWDSDSWTDTIYAHVQQHSRKPAEVRTRIQDLVDGPYVELFARETAENWRSWGNQVGLFDATAEE
ncbi:adenine methyltransferase [Azospirillum brasilense]|nr:adenine methyltransferase [Azospirillum argentinense]